MPEQQIPEVDWTPLQKYAPDECHCKCGRMYWSRSKGVTLPNGAYAQVTQLPCPACGQRMDNCKRISSPPDRMEIKAENVGDAKPVAAPPKQPFIALDLQGGKLVEPVCPNIKRSATGDLMVETLHIPLSRASVMFLSPDGGSNVEPGEGVRIDGFRFMFLDREHTLDPRRIKKVTLVLDYGVAAEAMWQVEAYVWETPKKELDHSGEHGGTSDDGERTHVNVDD